MLVSKPTLKWCVLIFSLTLIAACGGGSSSSGSSKACDALNIKIFNGEVCAEQVRSSVVAIMPFITDGVDIFPAGICTGTFVSVTSILTSAHCFTNPIRDHGNSLVGFAAVTGDFDVFEFQTINIHPLYTGSPATPYDLALARVNRIPIPHISPVPILLSELTVVGDDTVTFGYGTNNAGELGVLKAARMKIANFQNGNIIATLQESGASICPGDSGGPLVSLRNGVTTLVGVNSFVAATGCQGGHGSPFSGFVDLQNNLILEFIAAHAPDAAVY